MLSGITEPSEQAYRNFQRHVDRLCLLIVASDCSDREIDIERLHLRVQAAVYMPIGPTSIAMRQTSSLKCLPAENRCTSSMTS